MARNLGTALSGLSKPGKAVAPAKKGTASMTIEAMPAKPKTFTDKNLESGFGAGGANGVSTQGAKSGGSIKPEMNATPKMGPTKPVTFKT